MPGQKLIAKYGLDARGDILVSGTVDGVDIQQLNTDFTNHNHALANLSEKNYSSLDGKPSIGDGGFTTKDFTLALYNKLNAIEALADVTDSTNVDAAGAVMNSDYNAYSILYADTDNTPAVLTVSASTFVGRKATGGISAMTAAEARTILNVTDGADVTNASNVSAAGALMKSLFTAGTFTYATNNATPEAKTASEVRSILNVADGANNYVHPNHTGEVTSTGDGATVVSNNVIDADNLMGNSGLLGAGTAGQALVAGSTSKRFAYVTLGAAAYKNVITTISGSSSDVPTVDAVTTYVGNAISGLGKVRPAVADVTALKALTSNTDKDLVLVESLGLYRYDGQAADTGNDNTIVTPTDTIGRWFKISSTISTHANLDGIDKWGGISGNTYHVPNIDNNSAHFLRGDGTWATPSYYTHPNHTGDVTSTGDGATSIASDVVTNTKLANMANSTIKGRTTSGTGDPEDLTAAQVRAILNVADGATNYTHPTYSPSNIDTTGAQIIDTVTFANGHISAYSLRSLTLADLGYTGATNANNYVHPNHTGEVTSTGDGATVISTNIISPSKLKGPGSAALGNGSNNEYLQSAGDGTFKWGSVSAPSQVNYTYGQSISFEKTAISTSSVVIDSFAKATYRSVKWILSIYDAINSRYETVELSAVHDGTNVYFNEYGNVHTATSPNITFDIIVNGANIELKGTGASTNNIIKGIRHVINV